MSDQVLPLTVSDLKEVLFADFGLAGIKLELQSPLSKSIGDTAKVVLVSISLGQRIQLLDPLEEVFHCEVYPSHIEIWMAPAWKESNARRTRQRAITDTERMAYIKRGELVKDIKEELCVKGWTEEYQSKMANVIADTYKKHDISETIKFLDIAAVLAKHKEND